MDNLALVSPKPVVGLGYSPNSKNLSSKQPLGVPLPCRNLTRFTSSKTRTRFVSATSSNAGNPRRIARNEMDKMLGVELFASISRSGRETTSVGVNPQLSVPPPPSQFGSPLFWIGVGVAGSALFSWVASNVKKYAMQQAFKTMMGQMGSQNNQFNNAAFPSGANFPFPPQGTNWPASSAGTASGSGPATSSWTASSFGTSTTSGPATSPEPAVSASSVSSQDAVTVDASPSNVGTSQAMDVKDDAEIKTEERKYAFEDISPEETFQKSPFENFEDISGTTSHRDMKYAEVVTENGAASQAGFGASEGSQSTRKPGGGIPVEALEKMLEDPSIQKMVYPYLPEEMRNPDTFKWMLQNPQLRQQLEDMINNPGSGPAMDNRMAETLKNFDLSSPEIKQQFDQIGMTPEEVISKIMSNPDVAMAFQNPRVQAAIMDCSQNPMNIMKYQNDKEVMDVFNKLQELFPGMTN